MDWPSQSRYSKLGDFKPPSIPLIHSDGKEGRFVVGQSGLGHENFVMLPGTILTY